MQALLHRLDDAAQGGRYQPVQRMRQIAILQHDEAVGLLHVGGGLGQEMIRRDAPTERRSQSPTLRTAVLILWTMATAFARMRSRPISLQATSSNEPT